jgi:hypothetical protein
MVTSVGITNTLKTLADLQTRCNLYPTDDDQFFTEWLEALSALSALDEAGIAQIKQRYDYHRKDGLLLEGTINLVVVSPLLELAGFLDPPFRVRAPHGIDLEWHDPDQTVRGFIDTLVVQERLWVLVVESKRTSISVPAALPQLLAYLLAGLQTAPVDSLPLFGMASNGDEFIFLKLMPGEPFRYDVSRTFSLLPRRHELGQVLQILRRLGQLIANA